ncbi:hypothetical protein L950_0226785 [Sphingobacterium sp. IITKGP-BTPF85]|nr:hypothetical protein L950_0226785 [Sphingobacterium sp. IITKGP-BTPF85]
MLLALFGAAMGQGVVWYTGQFYSMSYMKTVMHLNSDEADMILGTALLIGTPFFILFGWLSDKVGRKWIMLLGMLLALCTYRPIYKAMYQLADTSTKEVSSTKTLKLADNKLQTIIQYTDGTRSQQISHDQSSEHETLIKKTVTVHGSNRIGLTALIFIQIIYITMVYGPIAAFLVEMFPVKIRYTSMSLPYHVGNGIFGGLLPAISTYLTTNAQIAQDPEFYLAGLWYPIIIAAVCFIIGSLYIKNKPNHLNNG